MIFASQVFSREFFAKLTVKPKDNGSSMFPMQKNRAKIAELKELITQKEGRTQRKHYESSSLLCGIPQAAITEIAGPAKTEWVLSFLKEHPTLKIFWLEEELSIFPTAIYQRGIEPSRILFAEAGREFFSCLRKSIRCQVFQCIIAPSLFIEEKHLKALQILTEKSNVTLLLLAHELKSLWPICLQFEAHLNHQLPKLETHPDSQASFEILIKKNKSGRSFYTKAS